MATLTEPTITRSTVNSKQAAPDHHPPPSHTYAYLRKSAMATLESLKENLWHKVTTTTRATSTSSRRRPLSDSEYSAGFDIIKGDSGWSTYQDFILPRLTVLLHPLAESGSRISVLEIGPGPQSILGHLPRRLRCIIRKYTAFEPNELFAARLEETFMSSRKEMSPLPCLESLPDIRHFPFTAGRDTKRAASTAEDVERFDVILFCHSMYGMKPKRKFIERALEMLVEQPPSKGLVVVFHRDQATLHFDGLVCHETATFPTGVVCVADDDEVLDKFARFVAGCAVHDAGANKTVAMEWRMVCRALGEREEAQQGQGQGRLLFGSPEIMVVFTKHATALPELMAQVPLGTGGGGGVKNRQARLRHSTSIVVRPTEIRHVQQCVDWALHHGTSLAVVGGGHSGHCLWPNIVSVDMGAFNRVHVLGPREGGEGSYEEGSEKEEGSDGFLVVAEAGCKSGDIVRETMAAGLTVPLGARPSVGAGLWLQGGIGHLARLHGLACDAVVGAVVVSVASGRVLCIGRVPRPHRPVDSDSTPPENEADLLWVIKGAGTNFGIVVSVTFRACAAPMYSVRNWVIPLRDSAEARRKLGHFDELVAEKSSRNSSVGAYIYGEKDGLYLGVTTVEPSTTDGELGSETPARAPALMGEVFGPQHDDKTVDGVGLFETEMYMSGMHGGHGGGKTSSFKRCLFLKRIGEVNMADLLVAAVETRPSPLCYLHLLQGGGSVRDVAPDATAFGCREWDFACVVTGVWPRDQDGTKVSRAIVQWVYDVATELLPLSCGAYGADLGPDPRDAALARTAFGSNRPRLARIKHMADPQNVLAHACPLPMPPVAQAQTLIILVTGESCAGKDYCADVWVSMLVTRLDKSVTARVISISDATKRDYAAATGAHVHLLLRDRQYKEQHRAALTRFFQAQLRQRPRLREKHFLNVVRDTMGSDVLLITGMRDEAPVAAFSHLVPKSRLLEVRIQADRKTRRARRGVEIGADDDDDDDDDTTAVEDNGQNGQSYSLVPDYPPSFTFTNESTGSESAKMFAQNHLLPFLHDDLRRLATMVRPVPDFPRSGIGFRHVLDISQQPGGLNLCTSLLQAHFTGVWAEVNVVACCEVGGFVFASALASRVGVPLALIREAGKLPPPTVSVTKPPSHISSSASHGSGEKRIEMGVDAVPTGASVVVVDDVLASGTTICAVLQLLIIEARVAAENVHVMVVAEFPIHRGREMLRRRGFGRVKIQNLLIFDGV
ncbi:hypothetical protein EsDP_00006603 [Epichloe bromicola]|uniref:FAD-binding PCMH-type domain-containing protein n=1 Tax=Epichloe bromicola TaxID=79588 RepID=A0ABQ0CYC2_9HYPO